MFSLASFVLAAIPFCDGTIDIQKCAAWMANDMAIEHVVHPDYDLDTLLEISSERIPADMFK